MSTNAQPRVLGRWSRTSWWCTLVHARRAFVAPAGATLASCDVRSRDDSGRQRPRVAPSADRNVHGPRRLRSVTSASRNVERLYVSERRDVSEPQRLAPLYYVSEPQRQRGAPSASRNVKRATSSAQHQARNVKRATSSAQRQARNVKRATSSAQRQARNGKRATWARRYVKAPKSQCGAKLVYAVVGEEQGRFRETTVPGTDSSKYKYIYLGIRGPSVLG